MDGERRSSPFFGAQDAGQSVGVNLGQGISKVSKLLGDCMVIAVNVRALGLDMCCHLLADRAHIASLLERFNGRRAFTNKVNVPAAKTGENEPDNSGQDCKEDIVDRHQRVFHNTVDDNFLPYPRATDNKADPAENRSVHDKENESLVIPQAHTSCQPWAVVIHLEHAPPARRTMVGAVGLLRLAFLAETNVPG